MDNNEGSNSDEHSIGVSDDGRLSLSERLVDDSDGNDAAESTSDKNRSNNSRGNDRRTSDEQGPHPARQNSSRTEPQVRPGRPRNAAFVELTYGIGIYGACVALPSLPRYCWTVYLWSCDVARVLAAITRSLFWGRGEGEGGDFEGGYEDIDGISANDSAGFDKDGSGDADTAPRGSFRFYLHKAGRHLLHSSSSSVWEEWTQSRSAMNGGEDPNYVWGFGRTSSGLSMVLHDIQFVSMLAVTLAIMRVWLVHVLVPEYLAPRRLEALSRCKSSHLLSSSSYQFEGYARRKSGDRSMLNISGHGGNGTGILMGGGVGDIGTSGSSGFLSRAENENVNGRELSKYDRCVRWTSEQWYRLRPSIRRALGHETPTQYNKLAPSSTRLLFSAPRHATAVFRLIYCSASCLSALILFRSAEFWPQYVGGTNPNASTENCWDLSGSVVALGSLDADYDHRNVALRYFFLTQASYQLHSLCFHVVSMMLLLLYGGSSSSSTTNGNNLRGGGEGAANGGNKRLVSMKTSMQSYLRPMIEHVIVLILILGSYLFSSVRRLGAVGIFTMEVSSVFVQLLQVCINAPESSNMRRPGVVIFVHRFLTIPTFVYCRFFVLPFVVWYSAAFESHDWLEQIEKVFSPGWGETIYNIFNSLLLLIFALNLVLFRRLLFHPHLRQIVRQRHEASRLSH